MKVLTLMVGMSFVLVVMRKWLGSTPIPTVSAVTTNPAAVPVNMNEDSFIADLHTDLICGIERLLHIEAEMDKFA